MSDKNIYWCDKINRIFFGLKDDYDKSVALTTAQVIDDLNYFRDQRETALQLIQQRGENDEV